MLQKSVAILAVFLSFISTDALALGLGRVNVESSLNQPLRVRIEVLQLGDTRLQDVNIQVATPEDFERFNIQRSIFLNNIRFTTDVNSQGNFVILTTNQIVREPYLSFILETSWANGRLLSEHTILLDLPVYEDEDEAVTASPINRAISAALTPQSPRQIAEPAAPTPASYSSISSVQPIIQSGVTAPPRAEDISPLQNTAVETSAAVESSTESDSSQTEVPSALAQTAADESEAQLAEDLAADSEPSTELEEEPAEVLNDTSEELADDTVDSNVGELAAGSAPDDSAPEEQAEEQAEDTVDSNVEELAAGSAPDDSAPEEQAEEQADDTGDSNVGELTAGSASDDSASEEQAEELTDDTVDSNVGELAAGPASDDSASEEQAQEQAEAQATEEANPVEEVAPRTITTGSTDTLSGIALRIRPDDSSSIQQIMLAIQDLNPDAFISGNINRLRNGEVLRVPSISDIQAIGQREAVVEVNRQNQQVTIDLQPLAAPSNTVPGQDEETSGQLSVITSDPDADSTNGAGVSVDADDNALDDRIEELENQLALREEEADRARIEKEELEFRLAELDERIAAAQEIIRLRDLQLAQLQQSLADAVAEAELLAQRSQAADSIPAEVTTTETQPAGFVDSLLKTLMGNSIALISAVVVVILALAGFLVRRNKGKQSDQEGLDSISENEFKGVTDAQDIADDRDAVMGSEFHDYKEAELDSELDEIISIGEQKQQGLSGISADSVLEAEQDVALGVDILIDRGQLEHADFLLAQALKQSPEDAQLLLKQLEITVARGDFSVFEMQAESLQNQNNPAVDEKIDVLRKELAAHTLIDPPTADAVTSEAETASFSGDLGFDLESFEGDSSHLADDPTEGEKTTSSNEIEFDSEEADVVTEVDLSVETAADEVVFETLEFDQNVEPELADGDSKDPEDLEIDTLEFDVAELEREGPVPAEPEEELDLETFSFDAPPSVAPPVEEAVSDGSFDDIVLDFDFDEADTKAETELDAVADSKRFDSDLDDDPTVVVGDADASDDLDFLAEEDIAFEIPDHEGDPESLSDEDETATKLELAYAYQKMGDSDGAREILREVISEGTKAQMKEAQNLIVTLSSDTD